MESKEYEVIKAVLKEYHRANRIYPQFHSAHEGYAVIKEELEELWEEIKQSKPGKENGGCIKTEAVQVAAMAFKFLMCCCNDPETWV